jgi:hypothetical protein
MGLLECLWSAARRYRSEKRDLNIIKVFLQSPERRWKVVKSATSEAKSLMYTLAGFAATDLQTAKVQFRYTMSSPSEMGSDLPIPPPIASRWSALILSAMFDAAKNGDGCPFPFATEKSTVLIDVDQTVPKLPEAPSNDLGESFMKALLDQPRTFIFSKRQPK